jgi:hypothetical protein
VVVRYASGRQVVRNVLQDLQEMVDILVAILNNDLEWTEKLPGDKFSLLFTTEVLNWH